MNRDRRPAEPNRAAHVQRVQQLRRSNAAGTHGGPAKYRRTVKHRDRTHQE